jgi:cytochrome P450
MANDAITAKSPCPHFDHHARDITGEDYYGLYERMREVPVSWSDANGGFWIVSGYEEVVAALKDHETFCSSQSCFLPPPPGLRFLGLESDPPEHGVFRKLFLPLAGRGAVLAAEDDLRAMTERIVGEFAAAGGGEAIEQVAERLPVEGIALMAGLSAESAVQVRELTVTMFAGLGTDPDATVPLLGMLMGEVERHRGSDGTDFFSTLGAAEYEGRKLTDDEIGNVLLSVVIAGHETTMNAASNLIVELARNPALQDDLRRRPELIPATVEETLRHRSPVHLFFRTVTRDAVLGGVEMSAGDKVAVLYASANRDPRQFDAADEFDLEREGINAHVAFGTGIHRCVGAPLAQVELRLLTAELLSHGNIELVGEPEISSLEGGHHLGWKKLPVGFV